MAKEKPTVDIEHLRRMRSPDGRVEDVIPFKLRSTAYDN